MVVKCEKWGVESGTEVLAEMGRYTLTKVSLSWSLIPLQKNGIFLQDVLFTSIPFFLFFQFLTTCIPRECYHGQLYWVLGTPIEVCKLFLVVVEAITLLLEAQSIRSRAAPFLFPRVSEIVAHRPQSPMISDSSILFHLDERSGSIKEYQGFGGYCISSSISSDI